MYISYGTASSDPLRDRIKQSNLTNTSIVYKKIPSVPLHMWASPSPHPTTARVGLAVSGRVSLGLSSLLVIVNCTEGCVASCPIEISGEDLARESTLLGG